MYTFLSFELKEIDQYIDFKSLIINYVLPEVQDGQGGAVRDGEHAVGNVYRVAGNVSNPLALTQISVFLCFSFRFHKCSLAADSV
jgi:hypothetical protein